MTRARRLPAFLLETLDEIEAAITFWPDDAVIYDLMPRRPRRRRG